MRNRFDGQMQELHAELIAMGAMCEEAISMAVAALEKEEAAAGMRAIGLEKKIDVKERDIEMQCMRLLTLQQPVARDLRQISAALKMITDMERVGDQARDIAELSLELLQKRTSLVDQPACLRQMASCTSEMLHQSVDAYVQADLKLAHDVLQQDNQVDALFVQAKKELACQVGQEEADGEKMLVYLMIAKYFERIGDHATNIAEWVIYSITGERIEDVL